MELWIRSQDKTILMKVNALWIMENQIWCEVPFYENCKKIGLSITGQNHKLATYKSKERALEVLDEIQNIIYLNRLFNNDAEAFRLCIEQMNLTKELMDVLLKQMAIYEMPEE